MPGEPQSVVPAHPPRHPGRDPEVSVFAASDTELLARGHKLVVVGYSHRTADLALRSRFAVPSAELPPLTRRFRRLPGVGGCVLLTTCNRVEAYLEIRSEAEAEAAFVELLGGRDLSGRAALARALFCRSDSAAVKHLLRVAAGLDSMVLADAQILGQVKQAYRDACAVGSASAALHKVFHHAFRCAKRVRNETELDSAQSVAGVGMALLARNCGGLRGRRFLLVGVNAMTRTAGRRLVKAQAARITVCNRTLARGRELAAELAAAAGGPQSEVAVAEVPWASLMAAVGGADAVITSTGATEPLFTRRRLAAAAADGDAERALVVVDLAVPPDVAPLGADADAPAQPASDRRLRVIDLEEIGAFQRELEGRRCEAAAAGEAIVAECTAAFAGWLQNQQLGPRMERLRAEAEAILEREIARYGAARDTTVRAELDRFGRILIKRFLGAYRSVEDGE
jgi:glutamyl-tRNA reductase